MSRTHLCKHSVLPTFCKIENVSHLKMWRCTFTESFGANELVGVCLTLQVTLQTGNIKIRTQQKLGLLSEETRLGEWKNVAACHKGDV